ncbi:cyclopropane-fatty-acyl-phospholipid synthase family protein [uncultured Clostridium sp.]|jgi:cyclopropane-fatty-acyl-phospholipid synthase|uniref:SAM-dependent methyltransferase n=1 Tax=uncultured Clostridium sp. TaxID=59620 RepID=UPI002633C18D|nr:cyclopropane-fatty-acyl-phospholipid synthase family protein [uncultured Clostridium sp.]
MALDKMLVKQFTKKLSDKTFTVKFWDGEEHKVGEGESAFNLVINKFPSKRDLLADASLALGEAYMAGDIDIEGNIQEAVESMMRNTSSFFNDSKLLKVVGIIKAAAKVKAKENIAHHYDIGNDFYKLWLDETMSYSCGYFKNEDDTLYEAQMNKIHHILKKLNLKEGQTLLDIGCGWGYLLIEAAKLYKVKGVGITLSEEQCKEANARIKKLGLEDLIEVKIMDYRDLQKSKLEFDRVVSVGMAEHVGASNIPLYFDNISAVLKEGGVCLVHNITNLLETEGNKWITTYIFPGGYVPTVREELFQAAEHGFYTQDVESLRLHYMKTLMHWTEGFEANIEKEKEMFDERFLRMWRMYLNSCAAAFHYGGIDVHQMVFTKGINNEIPRTRKYMYED